MQCRKKTPAMKALQSLQIKLALYRIFLRSLDDEKFSGMPLIDGLPDEGFD